MVKVLIVIIGLMFKIILASHSNCVQGISKF